MRKHCSFAGPFVPEQKRGIPDDRILSEPPTMFYRNQDENVENLILTLREPC